MAAVRSVLSLGYNVIFSDVDNILLTDPIAALLPLPRPPDASSGPIPPDAGVVHPLADLNFQANSCGAAATYTFSVFDPRR